MNTTSAKQPFENPGFNTTRVKVVCRIRCPKSYESQKETKKLGST